jgi:hypothetical protein
MVCNSDKKFGQKNPCKLEELRWSVMVIKKIWSEKPMEVKRVKTVANTKATTNTKTKNIHSFLQIRKQQQYHEFLFPSLEEFTIFSGSI